MAHREGIREYLKDVQVHGLVLDWGCGTKPIKKYLKPSDALFVGIDKIDYVGADVVVDFSKDWVDVGHDEADFAFCLEVLEHIWSPEIALDNIYATLCARGVAYFSVPFMYPVHKEDDYHRYTRYGLQRLFTEADFIVEDISITGGTEDEPWGYICKVRKI